MNFVNRAIKNVTRKLSKSILLAVTFFLIGNLVIVGLGISMASDNAKSLTRQKMKPIIVYDIDYEKWNNYVMGLTDEERNAIYADEDKQKEINPSVKKEDILELAAQEEVLAVNYAYTSQVYASGFEFVKPEKNENNGGGTYVGPDGIESVYVEPNITIVGNYFENSIEWEDGTFELVDGSRIAQADMDANKPVVLIEEKLAQLNNFRVGDSVTIDMAGPNQKTEGLADLDTNVTLDIIGIYRNNKVATNEQDEWMMSQAYYLPANKLLANPTALQEKMIAIQRAYHEYYKTQFPDEEYYQRPFNEDEAIYYQAPVYMLKDPLMVDKFVSDNAHYLKGYQRFDANNDMFDKFSKPLDTISLFANIIVWIVTLNAVVIITLVTALTLKTREYEIGVLLAMGVTKAKVVGQLFLELLIIAIVGFTLAVASGSLMAKSVGNMVLDYQVTASAEETTNNGQYWSGNENYFTTITQDDMLGQYEVSVNPLLIAEIYILGIGVVFISILIPSIMIMRFNPKRILMNQN